MFVVSAATSRRAHSQGKTRAKVVYTLWLAKLQSMKKQICWSSRYLRYVVCDFYNAYKLSFLATTICCNADSLQQLFLGQKLRLPLPTCRLAQLAGLPRNLI